MGFCILLAGAVATKAIASPNEPGTRSYRVSDLLSIEAVGMGAFDATGRSLVWEQALPYAQLREYAVPNGPPFVSGGFELRFYGLGRRQGAVQTLVIGGAPTGLWVGAFSRTGHYLSIFGRISRQTRAGYYDFDRRRTHWFTSLPIGDFRAARQAMWLDERRIAFLALNEGVSDAHQRSSTAIQDRLYHEWRMATQGARPTATEVDSPAGLAPHDPDTRVVIADVTTGSETTLASGRFRHMALSPSGRVIALALWDLLGLPQAYILASLDGAGPQEIVLRGSARWEEVRGWEDHDQEPFRRADRGMSMDGPIAAHPGSGARLQITSRGGARDLELVQADGTTHILSRVNSSLSEVDRPRPQYIDYSVRIGGLNRSLRSVAILPNDYRAGRRYPVIVAIYPSVDYTDFQNNPEGPQYIGDRVSPLDLNLLAAQGYIVYFVSNPDDWANSGTTPLANLPALVDGALDALVEQGYADPARIGLFGFSQGGYCALWLATNSARFRAIVASNSWVDPFTQSFDQPGPESDLFPREGIDLSLAPTRWESRGPFLIGATPFEDYEAYVRASPMFRARQIRTPVMLIHSDFDQFAMDQFERFFSALLRLGKPARFIRYLGEAHGNRSPANIRHQWANMFAWYDRYLDVARDETGAISWEGNHVRGWAGRSPFRPDQYYGLERIFGPLPRPRSTQH
jgi:hypothetical protein